MIYATSFSGHTSGAIVPAQGVGTRVEVVCIHLQAEAPSTVEWLSGATTISGSIDLPVMAETNLRSSWTVDGDVWRPEIGSSSCFVQAIARGSGLFRCATNTALNLTCSELTTGTVYWRVV